jgi:hypothetical protein
VSAQRAASAGKRERLAQYSKIAQAADKAPALEQAP